MVTCLYKSFGQDKLDAQSYMATCLLRWGGGWGVLSDPHFLLQISFSLVEISLHVELQHLELPRSGKCMVGDKITAKKEFHRISDGADGGPRSRVCAH